MAQTKADAGKIMAAMSGGVDSSVTAWLLKEQGWQVTGVTLRLQDPNWLPEEAGCGSAAELLEAKAVCDQIGIAHETWEATGDFGREVIDRFVAAYEAGNTPNPCVDCNRYIKFGRLLSGAKERGFDKVATGHYARVHFNCKTNRYELWRAKDATKDQSYVLYALTQDQLAMLCLPLGDLTKEEARRLAADAGLSNARRPDSQDICFVPDGDYAAFIRRYTGKSYPPGDFVDLAGNCLGKHRGMICYTVGQRKGLGLAMGSPVYVCAKRMQENQVVIGTNADLFANSLVAEDLNFVSIPPWQGELQVLAATRYRQALAKATAVLKEDQLYLTFDTPQRAVTAGQSVVLYDAQNGERLLCGGKIC